MKIVKINGIYIVNTVSLSLDLIHWMRCVCSVPVANTSETREKKHGFQVQSQGECQTFSGGLVSNDEMRTMLYKHVHIKKAEMLRGKEMNFFVENIHFIADHLSLSQ